MITRYTPKKIGRVWTDKTKFQTWANVEVAVVQARNNLGIYEPGIIDQIRPLARIRAKEVKAIIELDRVIEHDLESFVRILRRLLPDHLRRYIHDGLTSYDTEVPALALQFLKAAEIILPDFEKLIKAVRYLASLHQWTFCMGITHGQDAKPNTFGWRVCSYLESLEESYSCLEQAFDRVRMVKCSGAVGNYLTITPEEEREVVRILGLRVRPAATQIVNRDVFARFLSEIAIVGGLIEKIATDLRLLATSGYREVQEPRKPKQAGSSAMPHKANPILLERMSGVGIVLRGYAAMGQELIRTWLERDIAHSCVERIAFPDATILFDYALQRMTWIMSGLKIFEDQMAQGINRSRGCWTAEEAKLLLAGKGLDTETVYTFLQSCAFQSFEEKRSFRDVLLESEFPGKGRFRDLVTDAELDGCFDFSSKLRERLPQAYMRMGLDPALALPSNLG